MHQLSIVSSINIRAITLFYSSLWKNVRHSISYKTICLGVFSLFLCVSPEALAQEKERETIEMSVVAVNPSAIKPQIVQIKTYLPKEITPNTIVDTGGLDVEFDSVQSMYYVFKEEVKLKPSETRTFTIEIKDVWFIDQKRLDSLGAQTESIVSRLKGTPFFESANLLSETIFKALDTVSKTQDDETVSRRSHIGIYRNNLLIVDQIKDDINWLENQLVVASSLPKPDVLEEAELKTDSPTESTSWMIIFIIMLFIGMLAGVFFFTWQAQAHATKNLISDAREQAFPEKGDSGQDTL